MIAFRLFMFYASLLALSTKVVSQGDNTNLNGEHFKDVAVLLHKSMVTDQTMSFGGVLNHWINRVPSNDTDARRMFRFATRYARKRHPSAFPSKKDIPHTHYVRNINKLKLVYTSDQETPAMFDAVDPVLQEPAYIPIVWGVLCTFHIHIIDKDHVYEIIHHFTILEYIDERMYILEHSFHCERRNAKENEHQHSDFDRICSVENYGGVSVHNPQANTLEEINTESDQSCDQSKSVDSIDQSQPTTLNLKPTSQSDEAVPADSSCSKHYCSTDDRIEQSADGRDLEREANQEVNYSNKNGDFSILSYNIWNTNVVKGGDKEYIRRITSLAKVCKQSDADIITFQEVRFEDGKEGKLGPNQLEHLSNLLPSYQFVYQPGQVQTHGIPHMIIEGVAIFSRYPIIYRNYLLLSRNPHDAADGHQRVLLHAQIELPFVGPVHVLNTHLSLSHNARMKTVVEAWDYIQTLRGPVFMSGDMNAEAHNEEVRFLAGKYSMHGRSTTNFLDIWQYHHGNSKADNCSHHSNSNHYETNPNGFTFNTLDEKLSKRIDLMFMKEHPDIRLVDVLLIDNGLRGAKASSDHLGLFAKFSSTYSNNKRHSVF